MTNADDTQRAIAAAKLLLGRELIIQSDADFTPAGKRKVRVVRHAKNGRRTGPHIRWYVGGQGIPHSIAHRGKWCTDEGVGVCIELS